MKVEKQKTVKFTLELDPLEFLVIKTLLGSISGTSEFRKYCDELYNKMQELSDKAKVIIGQSIDGNEVSLNQFKYAKLKMYE